MGVISQQQYHDSWHNYCSLWSTIRLVTQFADDLSVTVCSPVGVWSTYLTYLCTYIDQELKSNKSFLKCTHVLKRNQDQEMIDRWKLSLDKETNKCMVPAEHLPAGNNLERPTWRAINWLRVEEGDPKKTKQNGASFLIHTGIMDHVSPKVTCPSCPTSCTMDDILSATKEGIEVAKFWQDSIWHITLNIIILNNQTLLSTDTKLIILYIIYYLFICLIYFIHVYLFI